MEVCSFILSTLTHYHLVKVSVENLLYFDLFVRLFKPMSFKLREF